MTPTFRIIATVAQTPVAEVPAPTLDIAQTLAALLEQCPICRVVVQMFTNGTWKEVGHG